MGIFLDVFEMFIKTMILQLLLSHFGVGLSKIMCSFVLSNCLIREIWLLVCLYLIKHSQPVSLEGTVGGLKPLVFWKLISRG